MTAVSISTTWTTEFAGSASVVFESMTAIVVALIDPEGCPELFFVVNVYGVSATVVSKKYDCVVAET